jgi:hypothetical protein
MNNELGETSLFFRKRKKVKRVGFQIPGTKTNAKRNNLERHLKLFQNDACALAALSSLGGGTITSPSSFNLF